MPTFNITVPIPYMTIDSPMTLLFINTRINMLCVTSNSIVIFNLYNNLWRLHDISY